MASRLLFYPLAISLFFLMENNGTSPHLWMIFPAVNLHFISHRIPAVNHPKVRTPTSTCLGFSYGEIMENPWIVVEKWWNIVINCDKDDGILMFFFFRYSSRRHTQCQFVFSKIPPFRGNSSVGQHCKDLAWWCRSQHMASRNLLYF